MNIKYLTLLLVIFVSLLYGHCFAQKKDDPEDYLSIPKALHPYLLNSHSIEDLTYYAFGELSRLNIYNATIFLDQTLAHKAMIIRMKRYQQYHRLRMYDGNGDKQITESELRSFLSYRDWDDEKKERRLKSIFTFDLDSDGVITKKEMLVLKKKSMDDFESNYGVLKAIHEKDKGRKIFYREDILRVLNKAFSKVDTNHDGAISIDENNSFLNAVGPSDVPEGKKPTNELLKKKCSFKAQNIALPEDLRVFAIGTYKGRPVDTQITDNRKTGQFDVYIHSPDKPVLLLLWGYDATIWNILLSQETELTGAVVGGFYPQILSSIKGTTPVFLTHHAGTSVTVGPCAPHRFNSNKETQYASVKAYAEWVLERPINDFQLIKYGDDGIVHLGKTPDSKTVFEPFKMNSPQEFFMRRENEQGLGSLMNQGAIREATREEIDLWNQLRSKIDIHYDQQKTKTSASDENKISLQNYGPPLLIIPGKAYIVLNNSFSVPTGIEENFILPPESEIPTGNYGRSQLMVMSSLECLTHEFSPCVKYRFPLPEAKNLPVIIHEE
ncbi:MAG: hypothetical protein IPH06_03980 [Alphaproteobacteria bacterium]|jgi:Ca2+-binding EF-hand superfamily protein|nr:hypothetical protein [Alphaproteobacteria bacterium]QQS57193.1 MAG: hypothetical protein IPN28_13295 [Alphaproteobacteria bacterium]